MSEQEVRLAAAGPPETRLPTDPPELSAALDEAGRHGDRSAAAALTAAHPACLAAWATLGDLARDDIEAYAAYRVGYHRGLDLLRRSGWRGSGFVRWSVPGNQPFLRCLAGLGRLAERIGEHDEAERCALFLRQLDPNWQDAADGRPGGDPS